MSPSLPPLAGDRLLKVTLSADALLLRFIDAPDLVEIVLAGTLALTPPPVIYLTNKSSLGAIPYALLKVKLEGSQALSILLIPWLVPLPTLVGSGKRVESSLSYVPAPNCIFKSLFD